MFALTRRLRRTARDERGGSLVEFALVFPVFLVFIIGIIEFSFTLAQNSELRHLAREGARIAATDNVTSQTITDTLCDRARLIDVDSFGFYADGADDNDSDPAGSNGAIGVVYAEADVRTITGWFDDILGFDLDTTVNFHVEAPQDAAPVWWGPSTPHTCST